ncbi:MAG TPA: LptF/LptG family permease [Azospirillaceae bacterium]|nr:LptF/LptG family permease [Azospirillaceae bacterium]
MSIAERVRPGVPFGTRLIDRYILAETAKPLLASLAVVLVALLLERLLRLFDLLAHRGGAFDIIIRMAANLVPHYLGLALPAAFFISIFIVVAKFGDDNELDALQSSGLSIQRIARPFLWLGLGLAVFSVALFGFIQPYSRYGYRALYHFVTNAAWDATVTEVSFIDAGEGVTISADHVDPTGRQLEGVFVHQKRGEEEWVTSAARGRVGVNDDMSRLLLTLQDGVQVRTGADGGAQVLRFGTLTLDREFTLQAPPYRPRGNSERELTLPELLRERNDPASLIPDSRLSAEFHARLVRALSLPLLPLLAVPMGMAAKRSRRGQGVALAAVILVVYHHSIQMGESLADLGRANPAYGVWVPFVLFAALAIWVFRRAQARPGENPFTRALEVVDHMFQGALRVLPRWRRKT